MEIIESTQLRLEYKMIEGLQGRIPYSETTKWD